MTNCNSSVKAVILYGHNKFFSSGNDLVAGFKSGKFDLKGSDFRDDNEDSKQAVLAFLNGMVDCVKPIFALITGCCFGMACTTTFTCADFIFTSKDAFFITPFIRSFQCPEGASTVTFPQLMGRMKANEMLLADKKLTAQEAEKLGVINGIIEMPELEPFTDIDAIPFLRKILDSDVETLVNFKSS